jgi:hypothetical protein
MYVAHVLPLSARAEITDFFAQSMVRQAATELVGAGVSRPTA